MTTDSKGKNGYDRGLSSSSDSQASLDESEVEVKVALSSEMWSDTDRGRPAESKRTAPAPFEVADNHSSSLFPRRGWEATEPQPKELVERDRDRAAEKRTAPVGQKQMLPFQSSGAVRVRHDVVLSTTVERDVPSAQGRRAVGGGAGWTDPVQNSSDWTSSGSRGGGRGAVGSSTTKNR